MLYIRSPELIHLITGSLYSLINIFPSLLPLVTTRLVSWKRSILLRNLQIYKTILLFSLLFFSPFGKGNFLMRYSDYLQLYFKVYSIKIAVKLGNLLNILLKKLPLRKRWGIYQRQWDPPFSLVFILNMHRFLEIPMNTFGEKHFVLS